MHYPRIIISDTHLGKGVSDVESLVEFLTTLQRGDITTDELILNGDIIDGWVLARKKRQPIPEMHARVIDALFALEAKGIKIIYIPGNHDEDLRRKKFMRRPFEVSGPEGSRIATISIKPYYTFTDPQGRRTLLLHGDWFDQTFSKKEVGKITSHIADHAYESVIHLSRKILLLRRKFNKNAQFSVSAYIKKNVKDGLRIVQAIKDCATSKNISRNFSVVAAGHIHCAAVEEIPNKSGGVTLYLNSGDWIDSCTVLLQDEKGDWSILDWKKVRGDYGFTEHLSENDPNSSEMFRPYTINFFTDMRDVWAGKGAKKLERAYSAVASEIADITDKLKTKERSPKKQARDKAKLSALTSKLKQYEEALRVV